MLLDVASLPRTAPCESVADGKSTDLATVASSLRPTINQWAADGLIKANDSFGFAAAHIDSKSGWSWDHPEQFIWFVIGWGPEGDRYIANAVRKLRPTLRINRDTLMLRVESPRLFRETVDSTSADGSYPWGDFPWGGGTLVPVGPLVIPCAVSGLREREDDWVAKTIGGLIGTTMLSLRYPNLFG